MNEKKNNKKKNVTYTYKPKHNSLITKLPVVISKTVKNN